MTTKARKQSYTIPCSSEFRDRVIDLANRRSVNVADVARSVLLVIPEEDIRAFPDPGGPPPGDREETVLKSGPSEGRPWRRKPRLQARLSSGYDVSVVRRALNLALILDGGQHSVRVHDLAAEAVKREAEQAAADEQAKVSENSIDEVAAQSVDQSMQEEMERLQAIVSVLLFEPLSGGVVSRADALHVLGFAPTELPDRSTVRSRFRMLATIHHPDSVYGSHERMSQLNAAMDRLTL